MMSDVGAVIRGSHRIGPDHQPRYTGTVPLCLHATASAPSLLTATPTPVPPRPEVEWLYEYAATVIRVIDGDTLRVQLDLGIDIFVNMTIRMAGIDAAEHNTDSGKLATAALIDMVKGRMVVQTIGDKTEKYGRLLALLYVDGVNVNDEMVLTKHAVPYDGGPRTPVK